MTTTGIIIALTLYYVYIIVSCIWGYKTYDNAHDKTLLMITAIIFLIVPLIIILFYL